MLELLSALSIPVVFVSLRLRKRLLKSEKNEEEIATTLATTLLALSDMYSFCILQRLLLYVSY